MKTVLAALDASAVARPVVESALGLAELTDATVRAVHVREDSVAAAERVAAHAGIPVEIIEGPSPTALLTRIADPSTIMAVFGARATPGGRRPVGSTALHILERVSKPIAVVPPEAVGISPRPFRRLLIPLEGNEDSSRAVAASLLPLIVRDIEVVVLHVFTPATVPRALDRPGRDLNLLADEFLARHCPCATAIELRAGWVGGRIADVTREVDADLVVLSWSQDCSPGRAMVVRDALTHASVPILLLPVGRPAPRPPRPPAPPVGSRR